MIDFQQHNEEVEEVWAAYHAGTPIRVPFGRFTLSPRIWLLDPNLNTQGVTWEECFTDPETMFQMFLQYRYHVVHHIPHDIQMGIPKEKWDIWVDFANVTEEAWLGSALLFPENQVPATQPRFTGERKWEMIERGIPDPFSGIFGKAREFYEYFLNRAKNFEFFGRPVNVMYAFPVWTDGPFTLAMGTRGPEVMEDMLLDEQYYHQLMDLITEAEIQKVKAWRSYLGFAPTDPIGGFADDAVQFLSVKAYREKVLPYHRRIYDELYPDSPRSIHLCGNVQRLLPVMVKELRVTSFDTGYPIDFSTLRDQVGEQVEIQGGVTVMNLTDCTPDQVFLNAKEILQSGIMRGGRFIMKEANNLAPMTPVENIKAVYDAVRVFGKYPQ